MSPSLQSSFPNLALAVAAIACVLSFAAIFLLIKILRATAAERERERLSSADFDKAVNDIRNDAERTRAALDAAIRDFRVESSAENRNAASALQNALSTQVGATNQTLHERFESFTRTLANSAQTQTDTLNAFREAQRKSAEESRATIAQSLDKLREENAKKLDEMRGVVDEKLQSTLEKRIGESFKLVGERLEKVHVSLGEMQTVAADMSDLKNVLANVKTRGTWGEIQLETLLADMLAPEQFSRNVKPNPRSKNIVEFAVKLPGDGTPDAPQIWLPIDSKFPKEDYERLIDASRDGDAEKVKTLSAQICRAVETFARDVRDRYVCPPWTTNFAVLFLPTEGLFAEILRNPGFSEKIQREHRVIIAGPTTLAALLNSLQVGFRTLAVQKNSAKIAKTLAEIRAQYAKIMESFKKLNNKLKDAQDVAADAEKRHKTICEKLERAELPALPDEEAETPDLNV